MKTKPIYLLAFYFVKPKDHVNTSKKGWMDNPDNIRYDEKVEFYKGQLKTRHNTANVVMNLTDKVLVKNSFQVNRSFDEVFRYFFDNYHKYLLPIMAELDPEYLQSVSDSIKAELDAHVAAGAVATTTTSDDPEKSQVVDVKYEEVKAE